MLHFFMATLSNISIISWSMNNSCILDVTICFGIVLCTGIFKNGITYPFTTDKISWNELIYLPIASLGFFLSTHFLRKGEHLLEILLESILDIFWTREPGFDPELCLPETPLFHLLFCFPLFRTILSFCSMSAREYSCAMSGKFVQCWHNIWNKRLLSKN